MNARLIDRLDDEVTELLLAWLADLDLAEVTKSNYVSGRTEMWFRLGSNLQSIPAGRAQLFEAPEPPELVAALGDAYLQGWHSLLVCGGQTTIDWHRDHGHFEAEAVMINFGDALFLEKVSAKSEPESIELKNGDVVALNIKTLHRSEQLSPTRFNVTFRRIKKEFL